MEIAGRQIRCARGFPGWTIGRLARESDLTVITISRIENGLVQPQERTLAKLASIFDTHGIAFLEDDGVCVLERKIRIFSGTSEFRQLLDHVYDTVKGGGLIRQFNNGDLSTQLFGESFSRDHIDRLAAIEGLDARALVPSSEMADPVSHCLHRRMDRRFRDMSPWYLYGDRLVLSLHETQREREFISIQLKLLTSRYLKTFDIFWNMAEATSDK